MNLLHIRSTKLRCESLFKLDSQTALSLSEAPQSNCEDFGGISIRNKC